MCGRDTDGHPVCDDGLQGLGGDLQQGAHPPRLGLAEDTGHLEGVALQPQRQRSQKKHGVSDWLKRLSFSSDPIDQIGRKKYFYFAFFYQ